MSESPPAWAPIKGRAQGSGLNAHDPAASPPTVFDGTSAFSRALEIDPSHQPSRDKRTEARRLLAGEDE